LYTVDAVFFSEQLIIKNVVHYAVDGSLRKLWSISL